MMAENTEMTVDKTENIVITTEALSRDNEPAPYAIRLLLKDNGSGFSETILSHAFEPYVTTKETGTGLGLPMVKKILDNHGASIHLSNRTDAPCGAQVEIIVQAVQDADGGTTETEPDRTIR